MKIKLIDFGGKAPSRKHYNDAGADVYARVTTIIPPHTTKKIPVGVGIILPDGLMGTVNPRSSMSSEGIVTHVAPVDSGYRGEIHAITSNLTDSVVTIKEGDRVGQLVIVPVILADFISDDEIGEERGNNGFGSTGK